MSQRSNVHAGTLPYWTDSASIPASPKLTRDRDADVVVVGGGITGLTTAYLIASTGRSVVLLERGKCAEIDTAHTTAHLTMVTDVRLTDLANKFGRTHAQAVWDAGLAAIAQIDAIAADHEIDCGFEWIAGYLHAPKGAQDNQSKDLETEATLASELGFDAAFVKDVPFAGGPGVRFENQARFHPLEYLGGLVEAIRAKGGEIYEQSEAEDFSQEPQGVKVNGRFVRCKDIVIATHNPLVGLTGIVSATLFQTKLALYTSYVVAGRVPRGTVPDALFWDTADPYQYLRIDPQRNGQDLVIFGGEDHKTGQVSDTNACYDRLERVLADRIPQISLSHRWSGQVIETPDGLPYIGRVADHQYAATGFAGNGMTFGTLAGMIIADLIQDRKNPWADLFDPGRAALRRGLWDYIKENADYPYYLIRDRFAGAEGRSARAVKPGEGKVIDYRGTKVAAYRGPKGALTLCSATCTHMGCIVRWNEAERTWDCPCHGSRFTPKGDVISGPAESPLAKLDT